LYIKPKDMTMILVFWDIIFACDSTSLRQSEGMCHLHLQGLAVQVTNSISSSGEDMVDVMHIPPFCETAGNVGFLVAASDSDLSFICLAAG
jgi:hypothetical protein